MEVREKNYLEVFLDIGKYMLESGAEIFRVEDTIHRLCEAYALENAQIFAIRSLILVTVRNETGEVLTDSRRIYGISTDLGRVEALNALSRSLCEERMEAGEIRKSTEKILLKESGNPAEELFGYVLAAGAFACFFGGNPADGLAAGLMGMLLFLIDRYVKGKHTQRFIYIVLSSMAFTAAAMLLKRLFPGLHQDWIMIGTIMLLVPGMGLMSSLRDMLDNNAINGLFSFLDAVMTAGAIAIGCALPLFLLGGL